VPKVGLTRWRSLEQGAREVSAETPSDGHLVSIVMRNLNVRLSMSGRVMHDGGAIPGMLLVTRPTVATRCVFRGPCDVLHLHAPNSVIAEFNRDLSSRETVALCSEAALIRDPIAERLARILLAADDVGSPFGELYADHVSNAIVVRLLGPGFPLSTRRKVAELPRWRLRRVAEYVEANIAEPVSLADLASAAGLTPMHFAAKFRAATGLRPHEYLLRRRIERAQEILVQDRASIVAVALSLGFPNQSHFTTTFKRLTGQPPCAWRQSQEGPGTVSRARGGAPRAQLPAASCLQLVGSVAQQLIRRPMMNRRTLIRAAAATAALPLLNQVASAQTPPKTKNVVFVHGLFADGSCWSKVIARLQQKGINCTSVQNPLTSLHEASEAARRAIAAQPGPAVLVGHSYSGMIVTEVGVDPKVTALEGLVHYH
jgi:AraC family transcriptional regulator